MGYKIGTRTMRGGNWGYVHSILVRDPNLSAIDKAVYLALADRVVYKTQICYTSHSKIADTLQLSRLTVIRSIKHLEKQGYLEIIPGTGRGHSNGYRLLQKDPPERVSQVNTLTERGGVSQVNRGVSQVNRGVSQVNTYHTPFPYSSRKEAGLKNPSSEETPTPPSKEFQETREKHLGHIRTTPPKIPPPRDLSPKELREFETAAHSQGLSLLAISLPTVKKP